MFVIIFGVVGLLIGLVAGLDAAGTVEAEAVGGSGVALLFQRQIVGMYTGIWTSVGLALGFIIEVIRASRDRNRHSAFYRALSRGGSYSPSRYDESASTTAMDDLAARYAAKREAVAAGLSPQEFAEQQGREREAAQRVADERLRARVKSFEEDPIRWSD